MTWQRAKHGRYGNSFTPPERECKMSEIRDAWRDLGYPAFGREAYLAMGLRVFCARAKGHYRTNGQLKDWALRERPGLGTNGGDVDNFLKLPKDALRHVAYYDDAQIVEYLHPTGKWYVGQDEMPRTEITLALADPVGPARREVLDTQLALVA